MAVSLLHSHRLSVKTHAFTCTLDNSDLFNQQVAARLPLSRLTSHGLFGQSHRMRTYPNSEVRYVEGLVDDYLIGAGDLFGSDFLYSQFEQ